MIHLHYEKVAWENRRLIGRCQICPLVREYDPEGIKPTLVIREGSMEDELKPPNWDTMSRPEKKKYFNTHKAQIIEDLKTLGHTATKKKWGMASSTLTTLKRRWHIDGEVTPPASGQGKGKGAPRVFKGKPLDGLPPLPAWNDNWADSVKVKWLEVWQALRVKAG